MSEIPSVQEELNRKSVDALIRIQEQLELGAINQTWAYASCKAIWSVCTGLINEDTLALAAQQADQIGAPPIRRTFVHAGVLQLSYHVNKDGYVLFAVDVTTGERRPMKFSKAPVGEREAEMKKLVEHLFNVGYVEI